MERWDLVAKSVIVAGSSFLTWMIGSFGYVFVALLGLMVLDVITGVMAGSVNEGVNSSIGKKGLIKKTYIVLLLCAVYLIEAAVLESNGIVTSGISGAFALMEFISIVENGGKMGLPLPAQLQKVVMTLKHKVENETEELPK